MYRIKCLLKHRMIIFSFLLFYNGILVFLKLRFNIHYTSLQKIFLHALIFLFFLLLPFYGPANFRLCIIVVKLNSDKKKMKGKTLNLLKN